MGHISQTDPGVIETDGRVAAMVQPERFETYVTALRLWYSISVYCPCPDHVVAIFDVITERKQAEFALRGSERLTRAVLDSVSSHIAVVDHTGIIVITDLEARVEYVNEAFVRTSGYAGAEVVGHNPRILHSGKTPRCAKRQGRCVAVARRVADGRHSALNSWLI